MFVPGMGSMLSSSYLAAHQPVHTIMVPPRSHMHVAVKNAPVPPSVPYMLPSGQPPPLPHPPTPYLAYICSPLSTPPLHVAVKPLATHALSYAKQSLDCYRQMMRPNELHV